MSYVNCILFRLVFSVIFYYYNDNDIIGCLGIIKLLLQIQNIIIILNIIVDFDFMSY